eukprot:714025-Pleurochrysis_carterae.AAC.1
MPLYPPVRAVVTAPQWLCRSYVRSFCFGFLPDPNLCTCRQYALACIFCWIWGEYLMTRGIALVQCCC